MIYITINSCMGAAGGGANTFAWNMAEYLESHGIPVSRHILTASAAIVIADKASLPTLLVSKLLGCFIIHRLDEHFGDPKAPPGREEKHRKIRLINKLADITVYQSEFVRDNLQPHLKAKSFTVIRNGGNPKIFHDDGKERRFVGHVTNSVGWKKRLDLLERAIESHPDETFLLAGNHAKSDIDFRRFPNVRLEGPVGKDRLAELYRQMKCLYFPSENDPCPNTVVEAILSGVPVCYNPEGGSKELAGDFCGRPLSNFDELLACWRDLRLNCAKRDDLHFNKVAAAYLNLLPAKTRNRLHK